MLRLQASSPWTAFRHANFILQCDHSFPNHNKSHKFCVICARESRDCSIRSSFSHSSIRSLLASSNGHQHLHGGGAGMSWSPFAENSFSTGGSGTLRFLQEKRPPKEERPDVELPPAALYKMLLVWGAMAGFAGLVRTPFTAVICVQSMFDVGSASDLVIGGMQAAVVSFMINAWFCPTNLGRYRMFVVFGKIGARQVQPSGTLCHTRKAVVLQQHHFSSLSAKLPPSRVQKRNALAIVR